MEKERSTRILSVVAICVAVIGMAVGFAAFSTTLNIQGTANVEKSSWVIKFSDLQDVQLSGTATEVTKPTINNEDTTISNYKINLKTPGDSATYNFKVVNDGSFDAKLSTPSIPQPECTGTGASAATDETNVCAKLTYTLEYADGTPLAADDVLAVGESKDLVLKLTYNSFDDETLLPKNDVEVSNLDIALTYVQK